MSFSVDAISPKNSSTVTIAGNYTNVPHETTLSAPLIDSGSTITNCTALATIFEGKVHLYLYNCTMTPLDGTVVTSALIPPNMAPPTDVYFSTYHADYQDGAFKGIGSVKIGSDGVVTFYYDSAGSGWPASTYVLGGSELVYRL